MGWKHVFIEPTILHYIFQDNANVKSHSVRDLLDYFAECAKLVFGQNHRFWQINSDLKFILNDEMLRQRELVTDAVDYPLSSCQYYESGKDSQGLEVLNLL